MIKIESKFISKLDLSNSGLTEFPREIFELKNLKKLNLSNNKIKNIPKEIALLKRLDTLDLSNNSISSFYAKLCELKNLRYLNLNNNQISTIPKQIRQLEKLRKFSIANNRLEELPSEFKDMNSLNALNISKNKFINFPPEILHLNIKHLWLCHLRLTTFPMDDVFKMKSLRALYAYGEVLAEYENIDDNYSLMQKIKGNCLDKFKQNVKKPSMAKNSSNRVNTKTKIFISYSHEDKQWLEKVNLNLKVLQHDAYDFDVWDDNRIRTGQKWKQEIQIALKESRIAILIISTNFLASDFIRTNELPEILKKAEDDGTVVLPLIVGNCRFTKHEILSSFQSVNNPSSPLIDCNEALQQKMLVKLANDVEYYLTADLP